MAIQAKLKKAILEDGRITAEEAKTLVAAASKHGLDASDREDLRTFFIRHEAEMEPEARAFVDEALGLAARRIIEQIVADRKVTVEEARFLVDEVNRNGINAAEREELLGLLTKYAGEIEAKARKVLEDALDIGVKPLPRAKAVRDEKELAPVREALGLVDGAKGKPVLQEVALGDRAVNPAFRDKVAPALKKLLAEGKSSLKAAEAIKLATGIAGAGAFKEGKNEPFLAGDRIEMTVNYLDGSSQKTGGIVVSAGASPLVLFANRKGFLQLVRQDPKSREQLKIEKIVAGRA